MPLRFPILRVALAVLVSCAGAAPLCPGSEPARETIVFLALGDVQLSSLNDRWSGGVKHRRPTLARMAQQKADFVITTGDHVEKGGEPEHWRLFDEEMAVLRAVSTIYPAVGNHDLQGDDELVNYFIRFPDADGRRYYTFQRGAARFLMVDSNLPLGEGSEQRAWLETQLAQAGEDVAFVFLAMHHPLRTRSKREPFRRGHSVKPEHAALAARLEQLSPSVHYRILVLSSHVHNYERYLHNGVTYITTGGGGGRPHLIRRAPDDFYTEDGPSYHFSRFELQGRVLRYQMWKLDHQSGAESWRVGDSFELRAEAQTATGQRPR